MENEVLNSPGMLVAKPFLDKTKRCVDTFEGVPQFIPGSYKPSRAPKIRFRTGVLQETFIENEQETGRARVRLHVADYKNSSEENGAKTKLGDEIVTAYCTKADPGDTIPSGAKVDLWFVNNRWDMVNMTCIGEE